MESATLAALAAIAACAVLAPVLAEVTRRARIPRVVFEILLGVTVGPQVLGWVHPEPVIDGFAELGLAFLIFLAGFEIDLQRVRGKPIKKATIGFGVSLLLGLGCGVVLTWSGLTMGQLIVGLALTTTALGTLLPILQDNDALSSDLGTFTLAIGTLGEFGPIVAVALLLTADNPGQTAVLLLVFAALSVGAAVLAFRSRPPRVLALLRKHLHSTAQLPIRVVVLLLVALLWVASSLGLDVLLGAFVAGVILRLFTAGEDNEAMESKLEGIAYGFFIPLFFIVSGTRFDVRSIVEDPSIALRVPLYLALFLLVRGLPTFVFHRHDLPRRSVGALSLLASTQLPLVVVITEIGLHSGRMRPSTASALVGAALLSVLIFPQVGLALWRKDRAAAGAAVGGGSSPEGAAGAAPSFGVVEP